MNYREQKRKKEYLSTILSMLWAPLILEANHGWPWLVLG